MIVFYIKKLFIKIKNIFKQIYKGYDDNDLYHFNYTFNKKLIKILTEKQYDYYWNIPEKYIGVINNNLLSLTDEQQKYIIETFIFHLKMCYEEFAIKQIYGDNINNINYLYVGQIMKQNQDKAIDLLKYFINDI